MNVVPRLVARLGLAARAAYASLTTGEIGWDVDTKVLRIGDDTSTPPQIASSKSTGDITYSNQFTPIFANVGIKDGGKVGGVEIGQLIANPGVVIRGTDSTSIRTRVLQGDEYIRITIPEDEAAGNILITASENLINKLQSSNLRYFYGNVPPDDARPGDMWFSDSDEIVYLRVGASEDPAEHIWLDFISFTGGGGGSKFFTSNIPPETAAVGDEWYDKIEGRLYKFLSNDDDDLIWIERV